MALAIGPGDTVWVSDYSNARLTGYPQDGGDLRTIAFPQDAGIPGQRMAAPDHGFVTTFRPLLGVSRGSGGRMQVTRVGGGGPDEDARERMLQQRIEKMTFSDVIPRVARLRVDPSDRIWVGVSEDTPDEVDRVDIYDRDGTLLGELRDVPFPDVFMGTDRIGVLRRDELDVQQVVVLEIERTETEVAG